MSAEATKRNRVVRAAEELVHKMKEVHQDSCYKAVWMLYSAHAGSYDGPTYANELDELDQAIKDLLRDD